MPIKLLLAVTVPFLFWAAPSALAESVPCEAVDGIHSICGLAAPEDLVSAPNGRDLIFGQMAEPGGLWLLDTRDDSVHSLLPAGPVSATAELWGQVDCDQPTGWLGAHGLDLRQRADGRWQLLVVNHTERESVEFFELLETGADRPRAVWRGCAIAPEQGNFNDVIGLADGSLLVTHMADRRRQLWSALLAAFGRDTGFVYRWTRSSGFVPLPGTGGAHPNGILLAPDEQSFYLNIYFGGSVRRHAVDSGALLTEVAVEKPDNSSWADDGRLLVASHQASLWQLFRSLQQDHRQPSLLPFTIVAIDPATMVAQPLLQRSGPPMGAGTVALQRQDDLYIGSYVGDRIVRLPMPGAASE